MKTMFKYLVENNIDIEHRGFTITELYLKYTLEQLEQIEQ